MIKALLLRNFRNYPKLELFFGPGIHLIYGNNGQGKTNLLEAISLVTTGRSFRTHRLTDLIREGAQAFFIEALFEKEGVTRRVALTVSKKEKKLVLDGSTFQAFSPLIGLFPAIFHTPDDLNLIVGAPAARRKFLDLYLSQLDPLYLQNLVRYLRAKKQRDALLKDHLVESMDCFEEEMAKSALYLMDKRSGLIEKLKVPFSFFVSKLLPQEYEPTFAYEPSVAQDLSLLDYKGQLLELRQKDQLLGSSSCGPHRDDFSLLLLGRNSRYFASEGEKRSCISALRLAEWKLASEERCVLIAIDDITSHLDPSRQGSLVALLRHLSPAFITAAKAPDQEWGDQATVFCVEKGKVHPI